MSAQLVSSPLASRLSRTFSRKLSLGLRAFARAARTGDRAHNPAQEHLAHQLMLRAPKHPSYFHGGGAGGGGRPRWVTSSGDGGSSSSSSGGLWGWYLSVLGSHPLLVKSLTAAVLNAIGDLLCQLVIEKRQAGEVDWARTGRFGFMGLALVGPVLHVWYSALNKLIPATGAASAVMQMALDQFFFAPLFLPLFTAALFTIEGKSSQIVAKLRQDWLATVQANWILWIPAQYLNFRYVPPTLQVLVVNMVALVWNVYMSFQSNKAVAPA